MKFLKGHFSGPNFYTSQLQVVAVSRTRTILLGVFSKNKSTIEHVMKTFASTLRRQFKPNCVFCRPAY